MNQWYVKKRHVFVLLTLVGTILMGLVWLAGVPGSVHAQDMSLLEDLYARDAMTMPGQSTQAANLDSYLTAEKLASSNEIYDGVPFDFQIILRNSDDMPIPNVQVRDILDPRLEVLSASAGTYGTVVTATGAVTYTIWVPPTTPATLTLQARVRQGSFFLGTVITNVATIDDGVNPVFATEPVTLTMADYLIPSAQINEPWNNQLITSVGDFTIKGRAWIGDDSDFPQPPVLEAVSNGGGAHNYYLVEWSSVPNAVVYFLQEATDPYFTQQVVDYNVGTATSKYIDNQVRGKTYYYRVKVRAQVNSELVDSRWSNVQSVTVNPTGLLFQPLNAVPVLPSVAPLAAVTAPTVEVNIKKVGVMQPDNWQQATTMSADPTGDWWNWTYAWSLPVEDDAQYDIQVRAKGIGGAFDPEKIDTVRVVIRNGMRYIYLPIVTRRYPPVPYAPTLAVPSNDSYGNYQLSWSYNYPDDPYPPTSYTLQEATDANFTNLLFNQTATSPRSYTNKAVGTYYYRVRGHNAYGAGAWSNVQVVTVLPRGFFDDFSNANSGWPKQVFKVGDRGVLDANYDNGFYRMKILLNLDALNNKRLGIVPAPYNNTAVNYDVQVVHRFVKAADQILDPGWGHAGLVFAAQKSGAGYFSTIYSVDWSFDGRCSVVKRTGIDSYTPISWLNMTNLLGPVGCPGYTGGYDRDVTFRAEVRGSQVTVFINTVNLGTFTDSGIGTMHQTGLATASWDYTPVQSRFDNFRLTVR